jgi:hypothetical protein
MSLGHRQSSATAECRRTRHLDLLSAPTSVFGVAHVARGLDGRNELECDITNADDANNGASNLGKPHLTENESAEEDIDLGIVSLG